MSAKGKAGPEGPKKGFVSTNSFNNRAKGSPRVDRGKAVATQVVAKSLQISVRTFPVSFR
jgi:hypothetical protein